MALRSAEPSRYLRKLADRLLTDGEHRSAFVQALHSPGVPTQAIVWMQNPPLERPFEIQSHLSWQPAWVDTVGQEVRPGKHELHDQGAYYCLDNSSVFSGSAVLETPAGGRVLDMCASPGGKSIIAWRALRPNLLVSNEVIGKRLPALLSNLKRCQVDPAIITSSDPTFFARQYSAAFDLVVVDAPCSGQSLVVKGHPPQGCFHPVTIAMNARRQRRILANAAACVRAGGHLAYMTCTFSPEENEENIEWLLSQNPDFVATPLPLLHEFRSELSAQPCYKLLPHRQMGAGAFVAVLRREGEALSDDQGFELPITVWRSSSLPLMESQRNTERSEEWKRKRR